MSRTSWVLASLALAEALAGSAHVQELLNVSYDPTRELYQECNAAFVKHWQGKTGKTVTVQQSHGGSSKQGRAVNMFHGRVEGGRAHLGPLSVDYPEHAEAAPRQAQGFARPYELELAREAVGDGFWATLQHVNPAGAVIKLELEDGETRLVQVETTRGQFEALQPKTGERLYVKPRQVRIFVEPGDALPSPPLATRE